MQYFPLIGFQHWVLGISLGIIALLLIYLSLGSHPRRTEGKCRLEEQEILFGKEEEKNPIPPALIFVFLGVAIFALGYFWLIGIQGPPFWNLTARGFFQMVTLIEDPKIESSLFKTLRFIFALAISFLLWGFLLFYTIGDKGPGESVHSTRHPLSGIAAEPDLQHVSEKPRSVESEERKTGGK
jgi:hypothetical protein